ncbi:MAG: gamma-glutamyl-gamma-aminobutyrate hydrolase family protein [bacterium]
MDSSARPLIAIPGRFSATTSALRYEAEVTARRLAAAVFAAGGEPVTIHPSAPGGTADEGDVRSRLRWVDAVLLPGGGDVDPARYGRPPHEKQYGVDAEQDGFDLAVARVALADAIPLLAVCRGHQVVNVALGGTLVQDMDETVGHHRNRIHDVEVDAGTPLADVIGPRLSVSCYHHQCIDALGAGLQVVARSEDGVIEGVTRPESPGWFLGTQWHPEDTSAADPVHAALFTALVQAAARSPRSSPIAVPGW